MIEGPPATHSQQNKIGVPPILELNNTSFGNRRTIAPVRNYNRTGNNQLFKFNYHYGNYCSYNQRSKGVRR